MINSRKSRIEPRGFALVLVALAWLAGILLDSWTLLSPLALLTGAALCLLSAIVFWRSSQIGLISLAVCLLLLGAWRYALVSPVGDHSAISAFIGATKLELTGSVTDEPKLQTHSRLLIVSVNTISLNNGVTWQNARGLVDVQMPGNALDNLYGAQYEQRGTTGQPPTTSTDERPQHLRQHDFPRLAIMQSGGNPLIAALYRLRIFLATIITRLLPQPMAALLIAIVLSLRTPALKPLIFQFNVTGTAHLIAPSGFKVTILAGLVGAEDTSAIQPAQETVPTLAASREAA